MVAADKSAIKTLPSCTPSSEMIFSSFLIFTNGKKFKPLKIVLISILVVLGSAPLNFLL